MFLSKSIFKQNSSLLPFYRRKSGLSLWDQNLTSVIKKSIENNWKDVVRKKPELSGAKEPYYVLSMFPYPSGELHLGHVRVYSISDTIARFYSLYGKDVIHPMGWDAFGLPAENAAIERNVDPDKWTQENISTMKDQLIQLGFRFDWDRELSTCTPDYYKWTQYIFLKLFEHGLVYRSKAMVNWDPIDQTVLADEQVDENGRSWRSGAKVEKKHLSQWFVRTTQFGEQLYEGLNDGILEDWKDIINLQRHWIGECDGVTVKCQVKNCRDIDVIDVWSSEPARFKHGEFLTVSSDSLLAKSSESESQRLDITVYNPINSENMPVFVCDDVEYPEGKDVYLASPAISDDDMSLSSELNFKSKKQSANLDEDREYVIKKANELNVGGYRVSSKLKDWLISRQRYWGTPIPIVHCSDCGAVPVPYENLPVVLPKRNDMSKSGACQLSTMSDWVNCQCPKCGNNARRETDTMDTFVDSSWYFLRYLDSKNDKRPFDVDKVKNLTPVNLYIGGKEHAVLHLYYARFMTHFLHSIGWLEHPEPFKQLVVQGMVMGKVYKTKSGGKYLKESEVTVQGGKVVEAATGEIVVEKWEKMSKSKHNGVNPGELLAEYGCDTTRMFMLSDVPPTGTRRWSEDTFPNVINWQQRLWRTLKDFRNNRSGDVVSPGVPLSDKKRQDFVAKLRDNRNYLVSSTTYNVMYTRMLSVAISRMQALGNHLRNAPPEVMRSSGEFESALGSLLIMLAPFCPHFACELWDGFRTAPNRIDAERFAWDRNVLEQDWPRVDTDAKLSLLCKVDGVDRLNLGVSPSELSALSTDEAIRLVLDHQTISKRIDRLEGIAEIKFFKYPGCRGIVDIFTNKVRNNTKVVQQSTQ